MDISGMGSVEREQPAALVVGAGIEGMATALLLADAGHRVYLLDHSPWIGGSLHLLDRTFPNDSCGLCLMSAGSATYCPTFCCALHPNITLLPGSELTDVAKIDGAWAVNVRRGPTFVDESRCDRCGLCLDVCPESRAVACDGSESDRRAIYRPPLRAVPDVPVIDPAACTRCGRCVEACPHGAIDLGAPAHDESLTPGAIVLAAGYEPFDARLKGEYGYGHYPNVVTSLEFERMTSASGPSGGTPHRVSDGQPPRRIAFIQCVGSRDTSCGVDYCSSICCMYTAKQVAAAVRLDAGLHVSVFHMDVRAAGKGYERYVESVQAMPNVTYRRSQVSRVLERQQTKNLRLVAMGDDGSPGEEEFDLVVLAIGLRPSASVRPVAERLGVPTDRFGFLQDVGLPDGLFVGGTCRNPMDVPEVMVDAAGVAAQVSARLRALAPAQVDPAPAIARSDGDGLPRIAVLFDRRWRHTEVDQQRLMEYTASLPRVAVVKPFEPVRSDAPDITAAADDCSRVLIVSDASPIGRLRIESVLGRGSWSSATIGWVRAPSEESIRAAVADLAYTPRRRIAPVPAVPAGLSGDALVIGAGAAGMAAAGALARLGHSVCLVEQAGEVGGQARELRALLSGADPAAALADLRAGIGSPLVELRTDARVTKVRGHAGRFVSTIQRDGQEFEFRHGVIVIANGGRAVVPDEYGYGQDSRVITQRELEQRLAAGPDAVSGVRSVVMIQCVGSRDDRRPYCSRICCSTAIKNVLELKRRVPEVQIHVLYRDVRTAGVQELAYLEARRAGVRFLRYDLDHRPTIRAAAEGMIVEAPDLLLGRRVSLKTDWLVLSAGIEPADNARVPVDLPVDADGFWQEAHLKMRPLDFTRPGVYACGLAHGPCSLPEAVAQGRAAAMRASAFLAVQQGDTSRALARVNARLCSGCELCVSGCPYGARTIDEKTGKARVWEELCVGCGNCAAVCRNGASQVNGHEKARMITAIDAAL